MRRYAVMVFRVCYSITRNLHDAEDAMQGAFLALHQQLQNGQTIANPGGWLQQVAQRLSFDILRGKKRRRAREIVHGDLLPPPSQAPDDLGESKSIVAQELDQLPPKYRLPLILHYFGGMSYQEMAREMKIKDGALRVRLCRAKEMLGKRLTARGLNLTGAFLAMTLEQLVHGAVTERAVSGAGRTAATPTGSTPDWLRAAGLAGKVKAFIAVGALMATGMTLAVPQAIGKAAGNVVKRIPQTINNAVKAAALPMLRSPALRPLELRLTLPDIHASAGNAQGLGGVGGAAVTPPGAFASGPMAGMFEHSGSASGTGAPLYLPPLGARSDSLSHISMTGPIELIGAPDRGDTYASVQISLPFGGYGRPQTPATPSEAVLSVPVASKAPTPVAAPPPMEVASSAGSGLGIDTIRSDGASPFDFVSMGSVAGGQVIPNFTATVLTDAISVDSYTSKPIEVRDNSPVFISRGDPFNQTLTGDIVANDKSIHVVPEPTGLIFLVGGLLLLRRRRRIPACFA